MVRRKSETASYNIDDDAITLAEWSKSPVTPVPRPSSSSSSSGKKKVWKEKEGKVSASNNVKRRHSDAHLIKAVVSRPGASAPSSKPSMVTNDGSPSFGQARSSAVIRAQEILLNLEPVFPSFVKSLVRSHVASCFWMGLPADFSKYLPEKDMTITLEDENGKQYGVKYIVYKSGLSAGWRQFAVAHKLLEGDVLVFQLVEPTKFKVYITRASDLTEVDGALCLLNLDSHPKQSDTGKNVNGVAETEKSEVDDVEATDNSNKKRSKALPLPDAQKKKKKAVLPKPVPSKPTEQSANDTGSGSQVLEGSKASPSLIQFEDVKSFDSFSIAFDGVLLDSEFQEDERSTYYKLCLSQNSFLHEKVVKGINKNLIAGTISETVRIARALKSSQITTPREDFAAWDQSLRAFELLGMRVGFLRDRLSRLSGLALEAEIYFDARKYVESRNERARAETGVKKIESKLAELIEACDKFGTTIRSLGSQAEIFDRRFGETVTFPW